MFLLASAFEDPVSEWFMAIALVSSLSSYAFYLGTRWGRYTDELRPKRSDETGKTGSRSWERTRREASHATSDFSRTDR